MQKHGSPAVYPRREGDSVIPIRNKTGKEGTHPFRFELLWTTGNRTGPGWLPRPRPSPLMLTVARGKTRLLLEAHRTVSFSTCE